MLKLICALVLSVNVYAANVLAPTPHPNQTYGAMCSPENKDYVDNRYPERIAYCARNVDGTLKRKIYDAYGIPARCERYYTIDHFIPLALGGSNAPENLWPEHKDVKATRPKLETELYVALRDGELTQAEAIQIIVHAKTHAPAVDVEECR